MRLAIAEARASISRGGGPFGCVITKNNKVVARAANSVIPSHDATAHAEVNALRAAGKKKKSPFLDGCTAYSTTEPCPMCFTACHWARISRIVYGSRTSDSKKTGFNELEITDATLKRLGKSKVELKDGVLRSECLALFDEWKKAGGKHY